MAKRRKTKTTLQKLLSRKFASGSSSRSTSGTSTWKKRKGRVRGR